MQLFHPFPYNLLDHLLTYRYNNERKIVEELQSKMSKLQESINTPVAPEDNTYDYVYDVTDLTLRPKGDSSTATRQTESTIR